ncbi:MAG: hypothetical protein QXS54_01020 [Candidatus Methanomethylicaceae archaeon]
MFYKMFVSRLPGGIATIVGSKACVVHDPTHDSEWLYYTFPRYLMEEMSIAMGDAGTRLWLLTRVYQDSHGPEDSRLATLDLRSGEWREFPNFPCRGVIYADGNEVIAVSNVVSAISLLSLQGDHLEHVATIPIEPLGSSFNILDATFLPDENRILILEEGNVSYALRSLSWDGEIDTVLMTQGIKAKLRFPFILYQRSDITMRLVSCAGTPFPSIQQ